MRVAGADGVNIKVTCGDILQSQGGDIGWQAAGPTRHLNVPEYLPIEGV
jgi:hypothetical protein